MIRLVNVTVRFGGVTVIDNVSLSVPAGKTVGLVGAGGAGKSVLMKLVCGLVKPDAGQVFVEDHEVSAMSETALMPLRSRIGMIFQNYALFDDLTVGENIGFPLAQLGTTSAEEIERRTARRLAQVHLSGTEHQLPSELSGGMKKRVCLARATIHEPRIMLCDDPTAGLDPVTTHRIFRLLEQLRVENGATALIASHETGFLRKFCDAIAFLEAGRLVFCGSVPEAEQTPRVMAFMTGEAAA